MLFSFYILFITEHRSHGVHRGTQSARLLGQWSVYILALCDTCLLYSGSVIHTAHPTNAGSIQTHKLTSPDLKSTTDDALAPYLGTLPQPYTFAQDHAKTNVRFLLGYSAVAIAAFTFYADRKLGWEATRSPWIFAAVGSYFVLNSLLTYWIWAVEAGEVYRGKRKSGETVSLPFSSFSLSPNVR